MISSKLFKAAFTLVELLVVIAIIGILSGLIIVGMNSSVQSAALAKAQVFSASLRDSLLINLVAEWKFDGTGVTDGSAATAAYVQDTWSTNNCTINGTPLAYSGSSCVYGSCLKFNGSTDYLNCGDATGINPSTFTIEAWVKLSVVSGEQIIIAKGWFNENSGGPGLEAYSNSTYQFGWGSTSCTNNACSTTKPATNSWVNLIGTYDGTTANLYVNGVKEGTKATSMTMNNANNLKIGAGYYNSAIAYYFNGYIDGVRFYSSAMPTSQIRERYYVGVNNLLRNKVITFDEYSNRLSELNKNLAEK